MQLLDFVFAELGELIETPDAASFGRSLAC
jgi:hypothetical protein